jgi:hypothetical protein
MSTFGTFVGGRSSDPPEASPFPRGFEVLLRKAKADPGFRTFFLVHPVATSRRCGYPFAAYRGTSPSHSVAVIARG